MEGGIYIHIPFCKKKCIYCDFYTAGVRIADWKQYTNSLIKEFESRIKELTFNPKTLYIGGGTPSLIPFENLKFLTLKIRELTNVDNWGEFTLEVNPEDVNTENIRLWKSLGINRLSMGVQSFVDDELKKIGRIHNSDVAVMALNQIKKEFDNFSIDLIYGLPGQTLDTYRYSLEKAMNFSIPHLSFYSLMLEEGTALYNLHDRGKLLLPKEEDWVKMYDMTLELLYKQGYERYEISNFSRPGYESRHNLSYWEGKPYIGLGAGSHSYNGGNIRRWNPNDLKGYLKYFENKKDIRPIVDNFYQQESLSIDELREEMIMTRMRMSKGLSLSEFQERFGVIEYNKFLQRSDKYIKSGHLKEFERKISFTDKGFQIFDNILADLI